jgi:predicted AlkP superfamily pyrophosphatase or phosphodiesterase
VIVRRSLLLVLLLLPGACTNDAPARPATTPDAEPTATPTGGVTESARGKYARIACDLPPAQLRRTVNGYITGKSGEIQFVLRTPHFFGLYSHSGPWNYLQRVPIFFYGPGVVPAVGEIGRPVTTADIAPTLARYLDFDFDTVDGDPLEEAVDAEADPPKLIVVVVWDAGGRNVLAAHEDAWDTVRRLIPAGAWFEHATVGTSPSVTPAVHATIGSGVFPRRHGVLDLRIRDGDALVGPILNGPQYMLEPTLADEFDRATGNRPVVGLIASEPTLGMMGHGSYLDGADRDIALGQREGVWGLTPENQKYFEFLDYVNEIPGLEEAVRRLDTQDGVLDGVWLDHSLETPDDILHTPAYAEYQTAVIEDVIEREGFGQDDVPDLLFTNYKQIDKMGHRWSFPTPQMEAVVRSSAEEFTALTRLLDREVGRGEWVMALTADHGATPLASETGAFAIDQTALNDDVNAAFDTDGDEVPVLASFRVTQLWINVPELEENGHTLGDVADFLVEYTPADNAPDPSAVPDNLRNERLFAAAFPGEVLDALPCLEADGG